MRFCWIYTPNQRDVKCWLRPLNACIIFYVSLHIYKFKYTHIVLITIVFFFFFFSFILFCCYCCCCCEASSDVKSWIFFGTIQWCWLLLCLCAILFGYSFPSACTSQNLLLTRCAAFKSEKKVEKFLMLSQISFI